MKNLVLLVCAILCNINLAWTQCSIQTSTNNVCLGNTVSFSRTPASATDSAFLWDFGDGSSSTQSGTTYQYTTAGTYTINLKIYKYGGTICTATPKQIKVFPKPNAQFTVNNKSQCYNYNNFLFTDLSGPGASNAPLKRRTFLYGDGAFFQESRPFTSIPSHVYTSAGGGKYGVVLEVEDTNGCLNQMVDTVQIFSLFKSTLSVLQSFKCGLTIAEFKYEISDVSSISELRWFWGDGQTEVSTRTTLTHSYYGDTIYYPYLIAKNTQGCFDTARVNNPVYSIKPDTSITITPSNRQCFLTNNFNFSNNTPIGKADVRWIIYKTGMPASFEWGGSDFRSVKFDECGLFQVKLVVSFGDCLAIKDTQVVVLGPSLQKKGLSEHTIQCGSHDTVLLNKTLGGCFYGNSKLSFLWDFDDSYAPPCTTDTKRGVNLFSNCRFSVDSINLKHVYSHPNQKCYKPSLYVYDSATKCDNSTTFLLKLAYPKVGYDNSLTPPEPRVKTDYINCNPNSIRIDWSKAEPNCSPEIWLLIDTTGGNHIWIKQGDITSYLVDTSLIQTRDSLVYYGIVASNGADALGNKCYDTAYYSFPNFKLQSPIDFKYELLGSSCAPYPVKIFTVDSLIHGISKISYQFSDNPNSIDVKYSPTDSVIKPLFYSLNRAGQHNLIITIETTSGCNFSKTMNLSFGKLVSVGFLDKVCSNQPISFNANVRYLGNDTAYWSQQERSNAGKEQLFWGFGDSAAWIQGLESITHEYKNNGTFAITLLIKDSNSTCLDTFRVQNDITVTSIKANISTALDTFYCAPVIVELKDSTYRLEGKNFPIRSSNHSINWVFDNGQQESSLFNPVAYYSDNKSYTVKLSVQSVDGCIDSTSKKIYVLGPSPTFIITSDTFGCSPFTFNFKNTTSKKLRNWIWYFNDTANTILSTSQDTVVRFTYYKPGVYQIDLLGEDRILNPTTGSYKVCSQKFPEIGPDGYHSRKVTVLPNEKLVIEGPDSLCVDKVFSIRATGTNQVSTLLWNWGDSSNKSTSPIGSFTTHTYDSLKAYLIKVEPVITAKWQCVLPDSMWVYTRAPKADFTYNINTYPDIKFENKSLLGTRFVWDFNGHQQSNEINPIFKFSTEDSIFTICLTAFDANDCSDSICKEISLRILVSIPNVFTPDNGDGKNDAFDIDIEGETEYELSIFNRWGGLVFSGNTDGLENDGVNWNGKENNSGATCPDGVYYIIFKYKLLNSTEVQVYHGTVTLIRGN